MKSKFFLLLTAVAILSSCSSPLDKKYNPDTAKADLKEIYDDTDSTSTVLIAGALVLLTLEGKDAEEMTYQEILEVGKEYQAARDKEAEELRKEQERQAEETKARKERLYSAANVMCIEKGFETRNKTNYVNFKISFENKADKEIKEVKGVLEIQDKSGEQIHAITVHSNDPIAANSTGFITEYVSFNEYRNKSKKLKNTAFTDLKFVWVPEFILYMDDERISDGRYVYSVSI